MKFSTIASVLAVAGLCVSAQAVDFAAGADVKSAYVATGTTVNDGFVFAPWVDIYGVKVGDTTLPFLVDVWGNMDIEDDFDKSCLKSGEFSEIDLTFQLDLGALWTPAEKFSWSVAYVGYYYPYGAQEDHLLRYDMGYDCFLNPSFTVKYRFGGPSTDKSEYALKISHSFALVDELSLDLSADCWYVIQAPGAGLEDGFACADFDAKLCFKNYYIGATYIAQIDDKVCPDATPDNQYGYDVDWIGYIGCAFEF